jgi:hypothetical protein
VIRIDLPVMTDKSLLCLLLACPEALPEPPRESGRDPGCVRCALNLNENYLNAKASIT